MQQRIVIWQPHRKRGTAPDHRSTVKQELKQLSRYDYTDALRALVGHNRRIFRTRR